MRAVWQAALDASDDEALGLHAALHLPWGEFGVPDFIAANAPSPRDALRRLERYFAIITEGGRLRFEEGGGAPLMVHEDAAPPGPVLRHIVELSLGSVAVRFRAGSRGLFRAREVWFRHEAPTSTAEHERVFEAPFRFGQALDAVVIPSELLDMSFEGASAQLAAIVEKVGDEQLSRLPGAARTVTEEVRQILAASYDGGEEATVTDVARRLGKSARTLQRALGDEGTTFRQVRGATRRELACTWLAQPRLAIAEVAYLLGFSEPSAFHRAFKRWTGQTPAAYRGDRLGEATS